MKKKLNKYFIVSIMAQYIEGRYHIEVMRLKLNKDGMPQKRTRGKFHTYKFSPSNAMLSEIMFQLFSSSEVFSRPSVHFNEFPIQSIYTKWEYDVKRIDEYMKGSK